MANDLATMKSRIASEIARSDLTTQIASAINDAILIYQKERFRFSESTPSAPKTFVTVANQYIYTSSDLGVIGTLEKIDYVLVNIGSTRVKLLRQPPENIKIYNQLGTMSGQPMWYGYEGNQLIIGPVPSIAYTIEVCGFFIVAAPVNDSEANNPWMIDAERLIRARAKFELATHVTRNPTMAAAMSPDAPAPGEKPGAAYREWRDLKGEANRLTRTGRVQPMQF